MIIFILSHLFHAERFQAKRFQKHRGFIQYILVSIDWLSDRWRLCYELDASGRTTYLLNQEQETYVDMAFILRSNKMAYACSTEAIVR